MSTKPKVFISYSHSSSAHKDWVRELASSIRANGADVRLDQWHLREGNDAYAFMESMVKDPTINKVLLVFDKKYCDRSNERSGGVGTETQIVTPELYQSVTQTKFVGITREVGPDKKPYVPTYYANRLYIPFHDEDSIAYSQDQLLRWVHDMPLHVAPPIGPKPHFLAPNAAARTTIVSSHRAMIAIRSGDRTATAQLDAFLSDLSKDLSAFVFKPKANTTKFTEEVAENFVQSIDNFIPMRNDYITVIQALVSNEPEPDALNTLSKFLENILRFCYKNKDRNSWMEAEFDQFRFICNELFLYTAAIFINKRHFKAIKTTLFSGFYCAAANHRFDNPMHGFEIFDQPINTIQYLNEKRSQRMISYHAHLLKERSANCGIAFDDVIQADLILHLRSSLNRTAEYNNIGRWFSKTVIYLEDRYSPLEIFARSQSRSYFKNISSLLSDRPVDEVASFLREIDDIRMDYSSISVRSLVNADRLCSTP